SRVRERLLLFSMVNYSVSLSAMSRSCGRVTSPAPGRSTLITSAPNHASCWVQAGPASTWLKSMILMPSSGLLLMIGNFLINRLTWFLKRISVGDVLLQEVNTPPSTPLGGRHGPELVHSLVPLRPRTGPETFYTSAHLTGLSSIGPVRSRQ